MKILRHATLVAVATAASLAACDGRDTPTEPSADVLGPTRATIGHEWSKPVLLDGAVNSPFSELGPALSADKLSLYFNSTRPAPGLAQHSIWVSRRPCVECSFEPAQPLPAPMNGLDNAGQVTLSRDGHLLFFLSNREGSEVLSDGSGPSEDIWMAWRRNPSDDFGWGEPVRLESPSWCDGDGRVNTEQHELVSGHLVAVSGTHAHLYFHRSPNARAFRVPVGRWGGVLGCAEPVPELGSSAHAPSVRADGRELVFWAPASMGGLGGADLWMSTRLLPQGPWSTPTNLGPQINSPFADLEANLSHDGTTLVFSSAQARGGLGLQDIWISTRLP